MGNDDLMNWKFPECWLNINKLELGAIIQAGIKQVQDAFNWEKEINSQIDAAQNGEELHAIEIIEKPKERLEND